MNIVDKNSFIRYIRLAIKGSPLSGTKPTRQRSLTIFESELDRVSIPAGATISCSIPPTSGKISDILNPSNSVIVTWLNSPRVVINIDLGKDISVHHIVSDNDEFAGVDDLDEMLVQTSYDGIRWYTIIDKKAGLVAKLNRCYIASTFTRLYTDEITGAIIDVDSYAFFDPKIMIWDNNREMTEYFRRVIATSRYYEPDEASTNIEINLKTSEGVYPDTYFQGMMVQWIQKGDALASDKVKVKIGDHPQKRVIGSSDTVVTLRDGDPYIAMYNSKVDAFIVQPGVDKHIMDLINSMQPKADNTALNTEDNTIIGAINEVLLLLNNFKDAMKTYQDNQDLALKAIGTRIDGVQTQLDNLEEMSMIYGLVL